MITYADLFSGFGGASEGAIAVGFVDMFGIELDDKIAQVARKNGHPVITANILDCDPYNFPSIDVLHASPPCTNASLANSSAEINEDGTKETKLDRDLATKTIQFVDMLRPRVFTLENVWQYRNFQAFAGGDKCEGFLPALKRMGYKVAYWHINSADFGVPQTRKRLILVASLDFMPAMPQETHYNPQYPELAAASLFSPARKPWVGWYEAIEDLIPTLPDSQFAPWQLARLPDDLMKCALLASNSSAHNYGDNMRNKEEPALSITTNANGRMRAFLVHPTDQRTMPVVDEIDPAFTMVAGNGNSFVPRAFLAAGGNTTNDNCARLQDEPSWTIASVDRVGNVPRAWLSQGRVVKMTPRAMARFQSFSDDYRLSGNNALDCKGIGNACPPLLFRMIYENISRRL